MKKTYNGTDTIYEYSWSIMICGRTRPDKPPWFAVPYARGIFSKRARPVHIQFPYGIPLDVTVASNCPSLNPVRCLIYSRDICFLKSTIRYFLPTCQIFFSGEDPRISFRNKTRTPFLVVERPFWEL